MKHIKLMSLILMIPTLTFPSDVIHIVVQGSRDEIILDREAIKEINSCDGDCRVIISNSDKDIDIRIEGNNIRSK